MKSNKMEKNMPEEILDFHLKGNRSYVQGPDIFNITFSLLESKYGSLSNFDISFHKMVDQKLLMVSNMTEREEKPVSVCSFLANGTPHRVHFIETGDKINQRIPFPEEKIISNITFSEGNKQADLDLPLPFTSVEIWVSMIKHMHQQLYTEASGKWIFVRGKFPHFFQNHEIQSHSVKLATTFGHKLTKSDVFLNDEKVGEIFFSLM